ncbi:MAG: hypothetical protein KAW92_01475 [Candidatus Cloacimonetes bacterium]|nr:hypothetical protein [Candidatus Cloacimonadota bacterium]
MDIEKVLTKVSERYSENTLIRMLICGIPYIGGSLDVLFSSTGQKIVGSRIEFLFTSLKKEIGELSEDLISNDYLESEEFFDLIIKCINSAVKTRSKDKIVLLSKIIKDSIIIKESGTITEEDLLCLIEELNFRDIEFIKFLLRNKPAVPKEKEATSDYSAVGLHKVDSRKPIDYYLFFLIRLEKIGLLSRNTRITANMERLQYEITPFLDKIIEYLKNTPNPDDCYLTTLHSGR